MEVPETFGVETFGEGRVGVEIVDILPVWYDGGGVPKPSTLLHILSHGP